MKKTKKQVKKVVDKKNTKTKVVKHKKTRPITTSARVYIQSSFNNTIITLTNDRGDVLDWVTAGSIGYKGTKKSTPYAATIVAKRIVEKIEHYGINQISILVKGVGSGRESAVRAFHGGNFDVASISDVTPIPHNGCRAKKPRRV